MRESLSQQSLTQEGPRQEGPRQEGPGFEMSFDERSARTRCAVNEFMTTLLVWCLIGLGLSPVTIYILIQFDSPEGRSLNMVVGLILVPLLHFFLPLSLAWRFGSSRMEKRRREEGVLREG